MTTYEQDPVDAAVRATLKAVSADRGVYRYLVTLGAAFGLLFLALVALHGARIPEALAATRILATTTTTWSEKQAERSVYVDALLGPEPRRAVVRA